MKFDKFGLIVTMWMSVVLSVVLSILLPVISMGFVDWPTFIEGFAVSFVISFAVSLIIPVNALGAKIAGACKAKPFSLRWNLITTAGATLIMATIMTLSMVYYFLPELARQFFISEWLEVYPYALVAIYVTSLIATPIGVAIAKKCCSVPRGKISTSDV